MATMMVDPLANEAHIVVNVNEGNSEEEGGTKPEQNVPHLIIWTGVKLLLLISGLAALIMIIVRTQSHETTPTNIVEDSFTGADSLVEMEELTGQTDAKLLTDVVEVPSAQPSWDRSMFPSLVRSSSPSRPPSGSPSSNFNQSPSVEPTEITSSSNSTFSSIPGIALVGMESSHTSNTSDSAALLSLGPTTGLAQVHSITPSRTMSPSPSVFAITLDTRSPSTNPSKAPTLFRTSSQPTDDTSENSIVPSSMQDSMQSFSYEPTYLPNALDLAGTNLISPTQTPSPNNLTEISASAAPSPIINHTSSPSTINTSESPTLFNFSSLPTKNPSRHDLSYLTPCFSTITYDSIDTDIIQLKLSLTDSVARAHFLGGIVRLAAHDFMDFDRFSSEHYGPDGCFDPAHDANRGLPDDVWCETCLLRSLYESKYTHLSRADFWIASANAVIRQTSINNTLDLKEHFTWGRIDRDSCRGSGDRIPAPTKCSEVENAFLVRMGFEWRDAVALLGAHSLGRGSASFSGHEGVWVDNADDAQVFDKQYYEELYLNAWRPRNFGEDEQDWTTGQDTDMINNTTPRLMLNTDLCLVYDIESVNNDCCTRTDHFDNNGDNECLSTELAKERCPFYSRFDSRRDAADAVSEFLGGTYPNTNNEPFYSGFTDAWVKATSLGWDKLLPLSDSCESQGIFLS